MFVPDSGRFREQSFTFHFYQPAGPADARLQNDARHPREASLHIRVNLRIIGDVPQINHEIRHANNLSAASQPVFQRLRLVLGVAKIETTLSRASVNVPDACGLMIR